MTRTPLYLVTADMPPRPYSGDPVLQELGHATHRVPLSRERALRRAACSRTWGSFDSVTAASASRAACAEGASISGWSLAARRTWRSASSSVISRSSAAESWWFVVAPGPSCSAASRRCSTSASASA